MPTCLRCGRGLVEKELKVTNWTTVTKKVFYSCSHCGSIWLYSKGLNCPVLIDVRNILPEKGAPRRNIRHPKSIQGSMEAGSWDVGRSHKKR